jgi:hypothetical protein
MIKSFSAVTTQITMMKTIQTLIVILMIVKQKNLRKNSKVNLIMSIKEPHKLLIL